MNKKFIVSLIVVAVIAIIGWVMPVGQNGQTIVEKLGAVAGPDVDFHMFLNRGATMGGNTATTSNVAMSTYTTSAADLKDLPAVVQWTPNLNITVTLASTTFLGYVPKIGDVSTVYFRNASSTAGATITFAALNANVDLQFAEATGGDLVLNGLDWAKLTIIHTSNNLITVIFDEMTEAD